MNVELLYDASFPLTDGSGRRGVSEAAVKQWLRQLNGSAIPTPVGVVLPPGDAGLSLAHAAWAGLREPLVVRTVGPSVASGNEVTAVRSGLRAAEVGGAISQLGHELAARSHGRRGYLVEEQQPAGVELVVAVRRAAGVAALSLVGGSSCPCPVSRSVAEQVAADMRVDSAALIDLLLAVAGHGTPERPSVVEALGEGLLEFTCDPLVVTSVGVCVVGAGLILAPR